MSDTRTTPFSGQPPLRDLKDVLANAERVRRESKEALRRAYELIEESRRARAHLQQR